jgi:hypothetical protein
MQEVGECEFESVRSSTSTARRPLASYVHTYVVGAKLLHTTDLSWSLDLAQ